jgi:hypothetical protein
MTERKDLNPKPQIRAYPRNPRHPHSIRFDEYYFINPKNHTHNPVSSIGFL